MCSSASGVPVRLSLFTCFLFGSVFGVVIAPAQLDAQSGYDAQSYYSESECKTLAPFSGSLTDPFTLCARVHVQTTPVGIDRTLVTVHSKWNASSDAFWGFGGILWLSSSASLGCPVFPWCLPQGPSWGPWWGGEGVWSSRTYEAAAAVTAADITGYYAELYINALYPTGYIDVQQRDIVGRVTPLPEFFIVPEPSSGLLAIAAAVVLAIAKRVRTRSLRSRSVRAIA